MSTLIRKGRIWGSALFAVGRYMLYNLVLTYSVWLGAIMNKTWHMATEKDKQS